ncbi:hypothetical protein LX36DRAFT_655367, partial [Colletotrichum falcatum]
MPPRLPQQAARALRRLASAPSTSSHPMARYLTTSTARLASPAAPSQASLQLPVDYVSPTKPPSARPPETRKSQLIRTYTSLLRTTPLILFFQHNNITADEWSALRRELNASLAAAATPEGSPLRGQDVQLQVLRTRMFNVALKLAEFFDPEAAKAKPGVQTGTRGPLVHDLSAAAYEAMKEFEPPADSAYAQISPLLCGPTAALVFPAVSPAHLAAALRVLAPSPPKFPAPTRKNSPGYYDPQCQNALQKLLLIGGRIEGDVFDVEGVKWVGGIEGGLDGLRAQLVHLLQSAGLGLTTALEGGSKSLWLTLEGRRTQLEDEGKEGEAKAEGEAKSE